MKKRGASHIEMVLSFLLFVSVVFVVIYFFNPAKSQANMQSSLTFAFTEISSNLSVNVNTYALKIDSTAPDLLGIILPSNQNARAESYAGAKLPSSQKGNKIYFDRQGRDIIIIRLSEDIDIPNEPIENPEINESSYKFISSLSEQILSEKRALALNHSYYLDYKSLKSALNLGSTDFAFSLVFSPEDNIISENQIPGNTNVLSSIKRKPLIRTNGVIAFADFGVKIW